MKPEEDAVLEMLYRKYFAVLEVHALRFLGNKNDAHIAAQEAFHIACEKVDVLMKHPNQIGWLKEVTKHVCQNMLRVQQFRFSFYTSLNELAGGQEPSTSDQLEEEDLGIFEEFLSKDEQFLLRRIILDGASYEEVAEELQISMWACRKREQRILIKFKKKYKEKFGEDFSM